jgi:hypothetical protein
VVEIFSELKHSVISLTASRTFFDGATANLNADRRDSARLRAAVARSGGDVVLKPSVSDLLAGTADALANTVLDELPPDRRTISCRRLSP